MNKEEEENEKSIYNYNMIFNRINNYEEDIKFNTDLISDIDLQNFDPERYEYYTNLLYIYNKDPKTLYDLLNKYYNIKSMHEKEKGIIKYIYDYARKLKELEKEGKGAATGADGAGGAGGGSIRRRRKRRNRQAGGVNTWQDKFINVLKSKMPDKKVIKEAPQPEEVSIDEEDDDFVYRKEEGVVELSKKIDALQKQIDVIKYTNNPSLGSTMYNDIKVRLKKLFNNGENKEIAADVETLTKLKQKIEELEKNLEDLKQTTDAGTQDTKIQEIEETINKLQKEQKTFEEKLIQKLEEQGITINDIRNHLHSRNEKDNSTQASPSASQRPLMRQAPQQASQQLTITASQVKALPDQLSDSLGAITDIANAVLTTSLSGITSTPASGSSQDTPVIANSFTYLTTLAKSLGAGAATRGGAGNSDEQLKMKYLDNNKYKEINTWKKIKELKEENSKSQSDNFDENNKIARLSQDIDAYNSSEKNPDDEKYIIQQLNNFENDPKNPLDELAITFDDRLVFIIATFFIRYITIIIVQWCIDINIIKTFYEGFIYYAIIYIIIFWFIVLFINIDNSYDVKYMNFNGIINSIRTLFYYFYMGTNGISRLLVHTSLIIILIIIPIILNIKRKADYVDDEQTETEKILNNDERKQLSKSLSLFTMFIWLFTSIIATKF